MEKKAMITIKGTQKAQNEPPQTMEFVTGGKLQRFGRKLRVSYEESELIGLEGRHDGFRSGWQPRDAGADRESPTRRWSL